MEKENIWEIFESSEKILSNYERICDFFSDDLPADFVENDELGEVALEVTWSLFDAKEFGKILEFSRLLQKKQPDIYSEEFQYLDDFLIDYYCFHGDRNAVVDAFQNFIKNPVKGYDRLLVSLNKITFYQHTDLIDDIIVHIFDTVRDSDELIYAAEFDLALCKYYIMLEDYFQKADKKVSFNKNDLLNELVFYNFNLLDKALRATVNGLYGSSDTIAPIIDDFCIKKNRFLCTLRGLFLKEMKGKNFHFYLSGFLWDSMLELWIKKPKNSIKNTNDYFAVNLESYESHLSSLSGGYFFNDNSQMIAVLWGSVYIYDFLYSTSVINQETYNSFKETSKVLKGRIIVKLTSELWNSNFVHCWEKPDSISEIEFQEEEKIFRKSISLKKDKFSNSQKEFSEELNNIGELYKYIIAAEIANHNKLNSKTNFNKEKNIKLIKPNNKGSIKTIEDNSVIVPPKVGRNEPCTCGSGKKHKKCCG